MEYALIALLALAAVMALFVHALTATARLMLQDEGRLRLHAVLRRHGVEPARAAQIQPYAAALATHRCGSCSDKPRCDAWLASAGGGDIEPFCPNAGLVRSMSPR